MKLEKTEYKINVTKAGMPPMVAMYHSRYSALLDMPFYRNLFPCTNGYHVDLTRIDTRITDIRG